MNGQQQLVGLGGLTLVGANFWLSDQRKTFAAGALNSSATDQQQQTAHGLVKSLATELLFVGVATLVAGLGPAAGNAMIAIFAALVILWAVKHYS